MNCFLYTYIGSLQNGWIDFLKELENGFSKAPWKWMENIDLLSSVLKLEVGGNCWRQQQLHSACVLSLEFEKALKCSPCYDEIWFGVEYDWYVFFFFIWSCSILYVEFQLGGSKLTDFWLKMKRCKDNVLYFFEMQ